MTLHRLYHTVSNKMELGAVNLIIWAGFVNTCGSLVVFFGAMGLFGLLFVGHSLLYVGHCLWLMASPAVNLTLRPLRICLSIRFSHEGGDV